MPKTSPPPQAMVATAEVHQVHFPYKKYNVTDVTCQLVICCTSIGFTMCAPGAHGSKTLELEPEELVLTTDFFCCKDVKRKPYGELGSVDKTNCLCLQGFGMEIGSVFPGWGCDSVLVNEVVRELKLRMKARGDTGQIRRTEQILLEIQELKTTVNELNAKMDQVTSQIMRR